MRRTLFTLMVTALAVPCLADDVPALTIKTTEAENTIALSSIAKVTYTDTAMVIFLKDSSTQTFDMDHITAMTFTATDVATQIGTLKEDAAVGTAVYTLGGVRTNGTNKKGLYIIKLGKDFKKVVK